MWVALARIVTSTETQTAVMAINGIITVEMTATMSESGATAVTMIAVGGVAVVATMMIGAAGPVVRVVVAMMMMITVTMRMRSRPAQMTLSCGAADEEGWSERTATFPML